MEYRININHDFVAANLDEAVNLAKVFVKENLKVIEMKDRLLAPSAVAAMCRSFRRSKKEYFFSFLVDTQNRIIERHGVSVGTLNASLIHPRECFRRAIIKRACGVVFVHNHPSGSLEPSVEDLAVAKRLTEVGKLIGIEVMDNLIVTSTGYKSFKEQNLI